MYSYNAYKMLLLSKTLGTLRTRNADSKSSMGPQPLILSSEKSAFELYSVPVDFRQMKVGLYFMK